MYNKLIEEDIIRLVKSYCNRHKYAEYLYGSREDMINELLLVIYSYISTYDASKASLSTWIYKLCYNAVAKQFVKHNYLKNKCEIVSTEYLIDEEHTIGQLLQDEDQSIDRTLNNELVKSVIKYTLPETYLFYSVGVPIKEISDKLQVSEVTIYNRIKSNLKLLRNIIENGYEEAMSHQRGYRKKVAEKIMNEQGCSLRTAYRKSRYISD